MSTALFSRTVERIDAESAAVAGMFGGQVQVAERYRRGERDWEAGVLRCEEFLDEIRTGHRGLHQFSEAMSSADFPLLFADSLDRQLYGAYQALQPTWQNYARSETVNDFRTVKRFATSGVRGLLTKTAELADHKRRSQTETEYEYSVDKYEAGFAVSFETMVNDDLGAFLRLPQDLAASATDSEEFFVTGLFCDASGPNASFYTSPNGNILSGNPALTRTSLQAAITQLMKRTDENGNPIQVSAMELVTGTGLALAANEILDAKEYRSVGSNGDVTIITGNGIAANLHPNVNYFIDTVATSANADTSWWLFASPTGPRPALAFGRLRGYESPQLFEKIPDSRLIGGGAPSMWSFDTSAAEKKVQHVFGGVQVDFRMSVASNGSGS
jgi:hypothetical protein